MLLVKISDSTWIEEISEQLFELHFGQISIRMDMSDFYTFSSMFDLSMGEEMPDDEVCSVSLISNENYMVAYRSFTMTMCEHTLGRLAELCLMGVKHLEDNNNAATKWGHLSIVPTTI